MAKTLTAKEAAAFQKYLDTLNEADKKALLGKVDKVANADKAEEARAAKKRVEFYYSVRDEIEGILIEKLEGSKLGEQALKMKNPWTPSKVLKLIANLPNKKPEKDSGYILAARNIEVGKKKTLTAEQKKVRKDKAAKRDTEAKQAQGRKGLFKKEVSDRKVKAVAKKKDAPKKKAPAKK